jgi:hypothetical protein
MPRGSTGEVRTIRELFGIPVEWSNPVELPRSGGSVESGTAQPGSLLRLMRAAGENEVL